jgi:hypothetical protein
LIGLTLFTGTCYAPVTRPKTRQGTEIPCPNRRSFRGQSCEHPQRSSNHHHNPLISNENPILQGRKLWGRMTSKPRVYGLLRFRGRYLRDGRFGDEDNILTIVHELFTDVFTSILARNSRRGREACGETPGTSAVRPKTRMIALIALEFWGHGRNQSQPRRSDLLAAFGRLPPPPVTPRCRLFLRCVCGWLRPPAERRFCRRRFSRSWRPSRSRRRHLARRHPAARSRS